MRWEGNRESDNVEDRRGSDDGGGGLSFGGRGLGLGSIVIALVVSAVEVLFPSDNTDEQLTLPFPT